jgi:hypothetical protein
MEYTVVEGQNLNELIRKIAELIKTGWKPLGGIAVTAIAPVAKIFIFWQAMVKEQP